MSNLGSEEQSLKGKLWEELGEDNKTAVHAILLESGFIGLDPDPRTPLDRLHLPNISLSGQLHYHNETFRECVRVFSHQYWFRILNDVCAKSGLGSPPCLISLPTDLKMKILQSIPGIDVASMGCVCKKLKRLCSEEE
ncbi:hypothetical protein UlMin_022479 [Ulmus minor]